MLAIILIILGAVLLDNPTAGSNDVYWGVFWLVIGIIWLTSRD
jgi:uncharacterized membrane protein HdeD (DUF308 family)